MQWGIWFEQERDTRNPFLNSSAVLRLSGPVDYEALLQSLQDLADRHETLSCSFMPDPNGLLIAPARRIFGPCVSDLSDLNELAARDQGDYILRAAAQRPFDLRLGPPYRATVVTISPTEVWVGISIHHISIDGAGFGLVLDDLLSCYRSRSTGQPLPAPPERGVLAARFAEHLATASSPANVPTIGYWSEFLANTDVGHFDGAAVRDEEIGSGPWRRGGSSVLTLSDDQAATIRAFADSENVRLFPLIAAAFVGGLGIMADQDVVRCAVSLRNRRPGLDEHVVGCFANELFFACPTDPGLTVVERAQRVAASLDDAFDHGAVTMADLARIGRGASEEEWSPARVYVSENNAPRGTFEHDGLQIEVTRLESDYSLAPLHLEISMMDPVQLTLHWGEGFLDDAGATAVLDAALAELMDSRRAAAPSPSSQPHDEPAAPFEDTLLHGLHRHAVTMPDATALTARERDWRYAALWRRVEALARSLAERGVRPGDRVIVDGGRDADTVLAHLAVLRSGAVCVPVDPIVPDDAVRSRVSWLGDPWVVTTRDLGLSRVLGPASSWSPARDTTELPAISPDQYAYILFTSGTTGEPHAFELDHRGLALRVGDRSVILGVTPDDVGVLSTPLSFDVSLWELYGIFDAGARIDVPGERVAGDPGRLTDYLVGSAVTILHATPTKLRQIDEVLELTGRSLRLRHCVSAGEMLDRSLSRALSTRFAARVYNAYGPAETAIGITIGHLEDPEDIHVGPLMRGIDVRICDDTGESVPDGEPGELWVSGVGVSRRYLNDVGAQRHVERDGVAWFRSGDQCRLRPDGNLEVWGREDQQVKVAGVRVDLAEVEAVLRSHPDILHASVAASAGGSGLRAWIEPRAGAEVTAREVTEYCRRRLHPAAVPTAITEGGRMKWSVSEKLQRPTRAPLLALKDEHAETRPLRLRVPVWSDPIALDPGPKHGRHRLLVAGQGRLADELRTKPVERLDLELVTGTGSVHAGPAPDSVLVALDSRMMSARDWATRLDDALRELDLLVTRLGRELPCTLVTSGGEYLPRRSPGNPRLALAQYVVANVRKARGAAVDVPLDWAEEDLDRAIDLHLLRTQSRAFDAGRFAISGGEVRKLTFREIGDVPRRHQPRVRRGETYVILGGHGGIGLRLAERLVRDLDARVVLLSRRGGVQGRGSSSERAVALLAAIARIPDRVYSASVDVSDLGSARAVLDQVVERWGAVSGVFDLVGSPSHELMEDTTTACFAKSEAVRAKVDGAEVLEQALADHHVPFVVHFSSVAGIAAPSGGSFDPTYGAANLYLDALAAQPSRATTHLTVSWGAWAEDGVFARDPRAGVSTIGTQEALDVLFQVLDSDLRHVVVDAWEGDEAVALVEPAAPPSVKEIAEEPAPPAAPVPAEPDPLPSAEGAEGVVATAWREALDLDTIGLDDDFFELGGHSLMLMNIINDLSERYQVFIALGEVLVEPTIRNMAQVVDRARKPGVNGRG